jgi:hypothetical protein
MPRMYPRNQIEKLFPDGTYVWKTTHHLEPTPDNVASVQAKIEETEQFIRLWNLYTLAEMNHVKG